MADIECHNYQQRLIQLSTVSSWWRKVTLSTPSLWGVAHSKDPDWIVSLALDRSKDSPLTVLWEVASKTGNLKGGESHRDSIGAEDFFKMVYPHTSRWRDTTLPRLGRTYDSSDPQNQRNIQLSRHFRWLSLYGDGSPSTENPITGFSGLAEHLMELRLHNLHVRPQDITRILTSSSRLVVLDLESLVALDKPADEVPSDNEPNDTSHPTIDLPCLTSLSLKWLSPSILDPIVRSLNPSDKFKVSLGHDVSQGTTPESFASFVARLVATQQWVTVHPWSTKVTLGTRSSATKHYGVELRGPPSVVLPWLRLRSLPNVSGEYLVRLDIRSDDLGGNPEQVVIENLMHFPRVTKVMLCGSRESWRWAWLLSLPGAVQTESADPERRERSWLWPDLNTLSVNGDLVSEFTLLSVLLARYGPRSTRESKAQKNKAPRPLEGLYVRPRSKVWRAEVLDRIRELVGPNCFKWVDVPK
ncbi:hypothetical protein FRC00_007359 [Tulasnella sp. 408]|nr:hypothetical protein FRC00_007359 [Tulasnella sp. 408]